MRSIFSLFAAVSSCLTVHDIEGSWLVMKATSRSGERYLPRNPTITFSNVSDTSAEVNTEVVNLINCVLQVVDDAGTPELEMKGGEVMSTSRRGAAKLLAEEHFLTEVLEGLHQITAAGDNIILEAGDRGLVLEREHDIYAEEFEEEHSIYSEADTTAETTLEVPITSTIGKSSLRKMGTSTSK
ncbi:MAG: uncharacterized protein KVP18_002509 [Porospora cf. gigantea A]|uniref:uncharacterized protein n=1 Tax=Porospora cf. gigantea A TaxID=2853593 RepID=UPI00355A4528|nr:MAG: hypothetical protein KVP18_002509 [Porospora cf. gigantea A]